MDTHPFLALLFRHLFDGVTEHGAGHCVGMLAEEVAQEVHASLDLRSRLAHLAEHPTYGLMHEVVGVVQVDFGITQAPRWVALMGGFPRADDTHALFPQAGAGSETV